jgi:hypothetical protein
MAKPIPKMSFSEIGEGLKNIDMSLSLGKALARRKIRLIEGNAENWPLTGLCGRFIRLRPSSLPITPYSPPYTYTV